MENGRGERGRVREKRRPRRVRMSREWAETKHKTIRKKRMREEKREEVPKASFG